MAWWNNNNKFLFIQLNVAYLTGRLNQGRNQVFFLGEAKPMGGHNLPPMVEIGLTYLKI